MSLMVASDRLAAAYQSIEAKSGIHVVERDHTSVGFFCLNFV